MFVHRFALPVAVWGALVCVAAVAASGCGGAFGSDGPTATATSTPRPTATPTPEAPDLTIFRGFLFPLAGACLPESDALMPNAPREYRGGVHEGVDFYGYDNCTEIVADTTVLAPKDGIVVRSDLDYTDLTEEELAAANERIANGGANDFDIIDLFRGRQVWIDHGKGIITRYAHLSGIAEGITEGARVAAGQPVAYVGDSGTPESLSNPGQETHLHWELRVGETFLGAALPPAEVREIYGRVFEPLD